MRFVPNFVPVGRTFAKIIMADFRFFKMAAVRHRRFVLSLRVIGPQHEEYLLVFVTVQNLVGIGAVVSITGPMPVLMFC